MGSSPRLRSASPEPLKHCLQLQAAPEIVEKSRDDIELIAITARAEAPFGSRAMIGRDCPPAEPSISPARDVEPATAQS
jgi:hypothetical protein